MTTQQKADIITAAKQYMAAKNLSQNAMCSGSKINAGYLSYMLKGELTVGETEISDKWFNQLAEFIGFTITKVYWPSQKTPQMVSVSAALQDAKLHPTAMILVGETGSGKTFMIEKFCIAHPTNTFCLTVGDHYRMQDIMTEIGELLGIQGISTCVFDKLKKIKKRILDIRLSGGDPVIIVDEAENLKLPALKMFKSLHDQVKGHCSIVLIGTQDIINKIEHGCRKDIACMPQFKRRFKAGIRYLPPIDTRFEVFLDPLNLEKGLVKLLQRIATNYGELRDYLEPALREADRLGQPLTENLFRIIYNMPSK